MLFTFISCGLSGGKTISLGYYEQDDIADVLDYIASKWNFVDTKRFEIFIEHNNAF